MRSEEVIEAKGLLRRGQSLLVAVSGGVDSMVLLQVLNQLAATHRWQLTVAHFNHRLRGRASDADERWVRKSAHQLGLRCVCGRADVKAFARRKKFSVEMAARELRHTFLARTARARGTRTIALAHHADDQVELFLLRILRGASPEGLVGMKWRNPSPRDPRVTLVRPFLNQSKEALLTFANEQSIAFRHDASNAMTDIRRNRIRHELIPWLKSRYQVSLERVLLRQMELLAEENECLDGLALDWLHKKSKAAFAKLPIALQRRVIARQIQDAGVEASFELVEMTRATPDKPVAVTSRVSLWRDAFGRLRVQRTEPIRFRRRQRQLKLRNAGGVEFGGLALRWQIIKTIASRSSARQPGCEWFDADKVGAAVVLRHWRRGDRFQPIGMASAVKLQDLFTNRKIPRAQRHQLVVAATMHGEIWWVEGLRISEEFKLDKGTVRRLRWQWTRKE